MLLGLHAVHKALVVRQSLVTVTYLHACVIEGDEGCEEIQVASGEQYSKQNLALSRDTLNKKTLLSPCGSNI